MNYGSLAPRCIVLLLSLVITGAQVAAAQPDNLPRRVIVVLDESVQTSRVPEVARSVANAHGLALEHIYTHALNGFSATVPAARLDALRNDPRVHSITEDTPVGAFCHAQVPEGVPTGVSRVNAPDSPTAKFGTLNARVDATIAILDTGVYSKHYDLNVTGGVNCTKKGCPKVTPADKNGHGTHVAGTAAALNNNKGVIGVAPGANLVSVKVLADNGSGWTSWIIAGIDYVTANSTTIDVANLSLGGKGSVKGTCGVSDGTVVDPFHNAICRSVQKGVVYVVAAGNEASDASTVVPAAYPEVVTVSAIGDSNGTGYPIGSGPATSYGADDTFASFSNYGPKVMIAAPGVDIYSTVPGDRKAPGGYCGSMSGTSMASPHVAGAAALYIAANRGNKTPTAEWVQTVKQALVAAGARQDSLDGFTGDPDHDAADTSSPMAEPLVDVKEF